MRIYNWKMFLKLRSTELMEEFDIDEHYFDEWGDYQPQAEKKLHGAVKSGWLGFDGATDEEIKALETRLGVALPPSYRQFLQVSNGFLQPGNLVPRIFKTNEVEWLKTYDPQMITDIKEAWAWALTDDNVTQNDIDFVTYIPHVLVISEREFAGTAQYFLNPKIVNDNGEWQAYRYAHWSPEPNPLESFWALMQDERTGLKPFDEKDGG